MKWVMKLFTKKSVIRFRELFLRCIVRRGVDSLRRFIKNAWRKSFALGSIPFVAQQELQLTYKGQPLRQTYQPDFTCYGKIIVELKAVKEIGPEHKAQVINYLKASGLKLGLLVNFGAYPKATIIRLAL
jgi:GxxExxY protein